MKSTRMIAYRTTIDESGTISKCSVNDSMTCNTSTKSPIVGKMVKYTCGVRRGTIADQ